MDSNLNKNGLTTKEARKRQEKYGKNELVKQQNQSFVKKIIHIVSEPMFLLLIVAASIYFVLGEPRDGLILLIFVIGIICIDIIQEWKTDQTLNALKELSAPRIEVIRDGLKQTIASVDLVPGDFMLLEEGVKIPADGTVIRENDLCVDESTLTGEAEGVWKVATAEAPKSTDYWRKDYCYAGTMVTQGTATILVNKIGANTEYGKIGKDIASVPESPTPLQKQTRGLVKICAIIAIVLFLLVTIVTFFNIPDYSLHNRVIESILAGIALAMAMIPEEFPVVLTVFLSMGAWRLAKKNSLVRRLPSVETLGAVSVLCVDKTGTITMNQMTVCEMWAKDGDESKLAEIMGLACESDAYDPMEKAMLSFCEKIGIQIKSLFDGEQLAEYAFTNEIKMKGHVWERNNEIVVAAKGAPESIMGLCHLTTEERSQIEVQIFAMLQKGYRVIAVGEMKLSSEEEIPADITDCTLQLKGLVALADPPREHVGNDIIRCTRAGVRVVMITGDNGITASSIAKQIGMPNSGQVMTGEELNSISDEELCEKVKDITIFSRVIPEHKMRIVKALKANGDIVAMTGDGVNDAPALKTADIGIAMGKRGSEVSREAADLILMDDNFSTIVDTIKDGRRIYDNIQKAIGYIFTIHIPIALASLLGPFLNIAPSHLLFFPIHVVLLELIIDPTCSIVLEREPAEKDIMDRKPRDPNGKLLSKRTLVKSVIQGLVIFAAAFGTYYEVLQQNPDQSALARTMGMSVLVLSNIFLVLVNSSNRSYMIHSLKQLVKDRIMWIACIGTLIGLLLIIYTPLYHFFDFQPLTAAQFLLVAGIAALSVLWYELVKLIYHLKK